MPLVLRLIVGVVLVLAGVTLLAVGGLGAQSRLRRTRWIGIRTPATMASEPAFAIAHRVGAAPAAAGGVVALAGAAVLLAGSEAAALDWVVLVVSAIGTFGLAGFAGRVGDRAATTLAAAQPAPMAACAGSCAGCDLIAGCRDQTASTQTASTQPASTQPAAKPPA